MKKAFLFTKILFIVVYGFAQKIDSCKDSVFIYSIINTKLECIVDSFIMHEQQYEYYDSSVLFEMTIDIYPDYTMILLMSGNRNNNPTIILDKYTENIVILCKQHLFRTAIRTNGCFKNLFQKTNLKQAVSYFRPNIEYEDEDEFTDDYWPTNWIYQYKEGCFIEKWKSPLLDLRK